MADRGIRRDRRDLDLSDRLVRREHLARIRILDLVRFDDVEMLSDGDALRLTDVEDRVGSVDFDDVSRERR